MLGRIVKLLLASLLLLVHGAFVLLCITSGGLYYVSRIYGPTLKFPHPTGRRELGFCGPSTDKLEDLIVNETFTTEQAEQVVMTHGAAIFESVLTKQAAQNLRDYAMIANHELESVHIQSPKHRYHVMPPHTEPSIQEALKEVAQHPLLRPVIDRLLGPSSTLVSLSLVTSEYGAWAQAFHADAETSHAVYPDLIVPQYTVAIALQDVTEKMGSTGLCPGTQQCLLPDFDYEDLRKKFVNEKEEKNWTVDVDFNTWLGYRMPCNVTADMRQGDAMLYNSDLTHRGRAHTDPDAPERAIIFIMFAGSPQGPDDHRSLPLGEVHALNWRMWGHTIDDCATIKERPWRLWHVFGFGNNKGNVRPWNLLDDAMLIFKHDNERAHVIADYFDAAYLRNLVSELLPLTFCVTVLYTSTLLSLILVGMLLSWLLIPEVRCNGVHMNGNGVTKHKSD